MTKIEGLKSKLLGRAGAVTFLDAVRCLICFTNLRVRVTKTPKRHFQNTGGIQNLRTTAGDQATVFTDLCLQPYPKFIFS
jgi:hypothetical protein